MQHILTVEQMRNADNAAINDFSVPGIVLMENAARSSAEFIMEYFDEYDLSFPSVLILCGSGNNGGDGFAVARQLYGLCDMEIYWIGKEEKMSPETKSNYQAALKLAIPTVHIENKKQLEELNFDCDCIIDSMIGVGGSENLRGLVVDILEAIEPTDCLKIAIDAPTGLNTDTGLAHELCFRADYTITMFAVKKGMMLNEGISCCGQIDTAYLGVPEFIADSDSEIMAIEYDDLMSLFPKRKTISSKFDYGRALVVAGSFKYPGAAALCANAAMKSGSGLVQLYTTYLHSGVVPDVIPHSVPATNEGTISRKAEEIVMKDAVKSNAVAIGPGLGDDPETIEFVEDLLKDIPEEIAIVIDADGLRAVTKDSKLRKNIILTPHSGELARLTGIPRNEIETRPDAIAEEWAKKLNCIILLKTVPVVITDGNETYFNTTGNPGMATGGCGDVLTGIITGFLAQGMAPLDAAAYAAFVHGAAGDLYASKYSQTTLTASALLNTLQEVIP